eukprot:TRINITY_DN5834_c0_g1_i9.p2 TRINITY_DN5834_c0_g1~~TRINITY_DN5834_c0_g1_i9.p2  ORF type:complete len:154 (+),score=11.01 TRINITY_DN5834_c0_g1_i9:891-1352(+)
MYELSQERIQGLAGVGGQPREIFMWGMSTLGFFWGVDIIFCILLILWQILKIMILVKFDHLQQPKKEKIRCNFIVSQKMLQNTIGKKGVARKIQICQFFQFKFEKIDPAENFRDSLQTLFYKSWQMSNFIINFWYLLKFKKLNNRMFEGTLRF